MIVVGVDPGARATGITLIETTRELSQGVPEVLRHETARLEDVAAAGTPRQLHPDYLRRVLLRVEVAVHHAVQQSTRPTALLAIEGVVSPTPYGGRGSSPRITDPTPLLVTAELVGALLARFLGRVEHVDVVLVRPGGNGHRAWGSYPDALVSAAEHRVRDKVGPGWRLLTAGEGEGRHARSAYDVARTGRQAWSIARRTDGLHGWTA